MIPKVVFAYGSISTSEETLSLTQGETASLFIQANHAAGRVNVTSENPNILNLSKSDIFLDNNTETINVEGKKTGTTTITIYNQDVTSYDEEDLTGKTITIEVTVIKKEEEKEETNPNNQEENIDNEEKEKPTLSDNNHLKSIEIPGYELIKIDEKNYTLTVKDSVSSIIVNAEAEDEKAKIEGVGEHHLIIGENPIEITITSESGLQNTILLKIIREDHHYLEDLEDLLEDPEEETIEITWKDEQELSKEVLEEIKESDKTVELEIFDQEEKVIYAWIIDGQKLEQTHDFSPRVNFSSPHQEKIENLTNHAKGMYINFEGKNLPKKVKLKVYVKDQFNDQDIINIYAYKDGVLHSISKNNQVKDGYIEFEVENYEDYFLTTEDLIKGESIQIPEKKTSSFPVIFLSIILGSSILLLLLILGYIIYKKRKTTKKKVS